MNYQNAIPLNETELRFTREKHGYSPREVDSVIDSQKKKIEDLIYQNNNLVQESKQLEQTLEKCNAKIHHFTEGMQSIEQERQKEVMRLSNIMTTAGRTAEETIADARRKAEEIIADAKFAAWQIKKKTEDDVKSARNDLMYLIQIIENAQESSNQHYKNLSKVLRGTDNVLESIQAPDNANSP